MPQPQTHAERKRFWEAHIRDWLEHHQYQTQAAYCAKHGLSESAFTKWKDRLFPKLKRSKHATRKSRFWEKDVKAWHESKASQAEYCNLNALSQSAFSKWKKQLHRQLGRYKERAPKNAYLKFAKITEEKIDILIRGFLAETSAKDLAVKANISIKTCYKYLRFVRESYVLGALNYPPLFNGAGMLLFFGPPPHIHDRLIDKYKGMNRKIGRRKRSEVFMESLHHCSRYNWSIPEAWYFYIQGWGIFYYHIYSKIHGLDPLGWNYKQQKFMESEYNVVQAVNLIWDYYFENEFLEILKEDQWNAFFYDREPNSPRKNNTGIMRDIKWVMLNHDPLRRNTYWDDYKRDSDFLAVADKFDSYQIQHTND